MTPACDVSCSRVAGRRVQRLASCKPTNSNRNPKKEVFHVHSN